ncbi:MAG TPA: ribonucleotide-diphosphate reductase subunit beta [Actinomycetota bacterium]|nr:ribonucleotide-diphosphate reductase subunit beta [Actinomycetota bacterium]
MIVDATRAERASLTELADLEPDEVLALMDVDLPDYRDLYYRWERQQWKVQDIDWTVDAEQWADAFDDLEKRSFLWTNAQFYVGENAVTVTLAPYIDAAPREEHRIFLTTQIVDEARHTMFYDRFNEEVIGVEGKSMAARLAEQKIRLNAGYEKLFYELLPAASRALIDDPGNPDRFTEAIVMYHIIIEGTLALTGQKFVLEYLRRRDLLPGFRGGFTAVARDESRHVNFGVRILKEACAADPRQRKVIENYLVEVLPTTFEVLEPPGGDWSYYEPVGYEPEEVIAFSTNSLEKRLRVIGVNSPLANLA